MDPANPTDFARPAPAIRRGFACGESRRLAGRSFAGSFAANPGGVVCCESGGCA
jgi:hypothetical protein